MIIRNRSSVRTSIIVSLTAALLGGVLSPVEAQTALNLDATPRVQRTKSVPVTAARPGRSRLPRNDVEIALARAKTAASSSTVSHRPARAERTVSSDWSKPVGALSVRGAAKQTKVDVATLSATNSDTTSSTDVAFAVTSQTAATNPVRELRLDPAKLGGQVGAGWRDRVRWKLLTRCSINKQSIESCQDSTPLTTKPVSGSGQVTAMIPRSRRTQSTMVVAASTTASGSNGDYSASPLKSSSTWASGLQSGAFTWNYDIATPAPINGPGPDLSINYSSDSVDGLTSATNNQASWIGDGFDLNQGFVERTYEGCRYAGGSSNAPSTSRDLCWRDDNLVMSFGGSSGELVQDTNNPSKWRLKSDDGSRIERVKDSGRNDDNDGEYWVLTKTDGTRYFFGVNKRMSGDTRPTDSVSTVPVYGSRSGDPCHASTFASSVCNQAWRWNLDYVVDPNGNTMSIFYDQETNKYGSNDNATVRSYDRASTMTSIEYGTRKLSTGANEPKAPFRVLFSTTERCLPATGVTSCGAGKIEDASAKYWPDVPVDQICDSSSSCGDSKTAPSFFSRKRLVRIQTEVLKADQTYSAANSWDLKQSLPATGDQVDDPDAADGAVKTLWLDSIQQTGRVGGTLSTPAVKFSGEALDGRLDGDGNDHLGRFRRFRLNGITNGFGGSTGIYYETACSTATKPTKLDDNLSSCLPSYYEPDWDPDADTRQLEFFHKYRVKSVQETDRTMSSTPGVVTNYTYDNLVSDGSGAATQQTGWHYANATTERRRYRTWNDWRGYARVTTEVGTADSGKTFSRASFLRGMDGDKKESGTRSVTVNGLRDANQAAGFQTRSETRLGRDGALVSQEDTSPWLSSVTADSGLEQARMVREGTTTTTTAVSGASARVTKSTTTYNDSGLPTKTDDRGDVAATPGTDDDRCTTTDYAPVDASAWMLDYPGTVTTIGRTCGTAPTADEDVVSAARTSYDSRGNVVKEESAKSLSEGVLAYQTDTTTTVDSYGRTTETSDAASKKTTLTYAPDTGPVDNVTTTNALGQKSETTIDRVLGQPTKQRSVGGEEVSFSYDPLARKTAVWGPGRIKGTDTPTAQMSYDITDTSPNKVTTKRLNASGEYTTSVTYLDGLLREQSTQTMAAGPNDGRLITEKEYDERGLVKSTRGPYFNSGAVGSGVVYAQQNAIPSLHFLTYDQAGRQVSDEFSSRGNYKWKTTTAYGGDRVTVTPPEGGTRATTYTDARGQKTALLQYKSAAPSTDADRTTYSYNRQGNLASITNAAGNVWRKSYDVRGRQVKNVDPDRGTSTATYDALDRQQSSTDARGTTLWTTYDALGRKTGLNNDSAGTSKRAEWLYDTIKAGYETSSTRYVGSSKITNEVLSYDTAGRVTASTLVLPTSLKDLDPQIDAGTYTVPTGGYKSRFVYNPDDSINTVYQPSVPGITNELLTYSYDKLGNVDTMEGDGSFISSTVRTPYGQTLQRQMGPTFGKAVFDSREYDEATQRLTRHWTSLQGSGTVAQQDLRYSYDPAGNLKQLNDVAAGDSTQNGASTWRQCFTYDHVQRLTQAWTVPTNSCTSKPSSSAPNLGTTNPYWDEFTYDASGNRTKRVQHTKSGTSDKSVTWTSTFPGSTSARPHAPTTVAKSGSETASETFGYDAAGNTISRSTSSTAGQTMAWDAEGRQSGVQIKNKDDVSYLYDAEGTRILKREGTTATLYIGNAEITLSKTATKSTRTYTVDDEPVAMRDRDGLKVLIGDHHNTSSLAIEGDDLTVTKRRFDPFGNPAAGSSTTTTWPSDRGFLNKTVDKATSTAHVGEREYDATLGRFLSADPLVPPDNPQQLNGYAYANNSPLSYVDADGLSPRSDERDAQIANGSVQATGSSSSSHRGGGGGGGGGSSSFAGTHPAQDNFYRPGDQNQMSPTHPGYLPYGTGFHNQDNMAFWHGFLDWVGFVPVLGEPADAVNAGLYISEGDWLNAIISGGAFVPVVGSVGTAGRRGYKIVNALKDAEKTADHGRDAAKAIDVAKRRVKLREGTREAIRDAAPKNADGDYIMPGKPGSVIPKEGPYHYGHRPGFEWWRTQKKAREEGWSREQLIEYENDPTHYRIEDPYRNMSHQDEMPR